MKSGWKYVCGAVVLVAIGSLAWAFEYKPNTFSGVTTETPEITGETKTSTQVKNSAAPVPAINETFVGPRGNLPTDAPSAYGFWSFSMPVPGVYSRSGQPLMSEFTWLKNNGWKGDVNLRITGDHGDVADDAKLPGFSALGLNYLHLEIIDGHAPTDAQAEQFLQFVTSPANQPVIVHCRGGYGRTGTVTALYRYAVQSWSMDKAIEESRLYNGGIDDVQKSWLLTWATNHAPGSYANH